MTGRLQLGISVIVSTLTVCALVVNGCGGSRVEGVTTIEPGVVTQSFSDPPGDVRNASSAPNLAPLIDITSAELSLSTKDATLRVRTAANIPAGGPQYVHQISYVLEFQPVLGKNATFSIQINRTENQWSVYENQVEFETPPTVTGDQLTVVLPLAQLPSLNADFKWRLSTWIYLEIVGEGPKKLNDFCPNWSSDWSDVPSFPKMP